MLIMKVRKSSVTSMLMLSSNRTPISLISTRIVPATYAAHLEMDSNVIIYQKLYDEVSKKWGERDEPTSETDPVKSNGRLSHRILVSHPHPLNQTSPCQKLALCCSAQIQMIPEVSKKF